MKYIIILIMTILLNSCNTKQVENIAPTQTKENLVTLTPEQTKNAGIQTDKIGLKNIASILKVNGIIDVPPQNMVSISVPLGGYLKSTNLLPGMHVRKGEMLATIEDQLYITLQQEYLTAKAKLEYMESEFVRQEELNRSKASSDKVFQLAKADFTTQKILLKSLSEKLKLIGINPDRLNENNLSRSIQIYSPTDGYVSHVNMNIGKYANPSDVLFEIVNPTDIHLALTIFEKDVDKLFIGQNLVAYNNNNQAKKYPCKVILVGKDLSKDRSIEVHCHFEQYDKALIPGMFMNAEIEVESSSACTIASEAIVMFEGKQYIFSALGNGKYQLHEVKTLNSENSQTQIEFVENLDYTKMNFVTVGAYSLLMKMKNNEE